MFRRTIKGFLMFSQTADYIHFSNRSVEATAAMANISISLAVLLVFAEGTCAFIWERTKTVREEESKSDKLFSNFITLT